MATAVVKQERGREIRAGRDVINTMNITYNLQNRGRMCQECVGVNWPLSKCCNKKEPGLNHDDAAVDLRTYT